MHSEVCVVNVYHMECDVGYVCGCFAPGCLGRDEHGVVESTFEGGPSRVALRLLNKRV